MHPKPAYKLSFLEKLNELLRAMNYYNAGKSGRTRMRK